MDWQNILSKRETVYFARLQEKCIPETVEEVTIPVICIKFDCKYFDDMLLTWDLDKGPWGLFPWYIQLALPSTLIHT